MTHISQISVAANKAVVELAEALLARNFTHTQVAQIVGQVYETCGTYGYRPAK